jgi:two-component system OmpR family response regulator
VHILVCEDSPELAGQIEATLRRDGFGVAVATDGMQALRHGAAGDYAAIVIEKQLPGRDGLSVLRAWRADGRTTPVIMLAARLRRIETVAVLDAGADDCVAKPVDLAELAARVRALVRRSGGMLAPVIIRGPLRIDTGRRLVSLDGAPVVLTRLEYGLLAVLAQNAERTLDLAELKRLLYPQGGGGDWNALAVIASRIRQKLGPGMILTVRGFGYRLGTPGPAGAGGGQATSFNFGAEPR